MWFPWGGVASRVSEIESVQGLYDFYIYDIRDIYKSHTIPGRSQSQRLLYI